MTLLRLNFVVSLMNSLWWLLLPSLCILDSTAKSFRPHLSAPVGLWFPSGFLKILDDTHRGLEVPRGGWNSQERQQAGLTLPDRGSGDTPPPCPRPSVREPEPSTHTGAHTLRGSPGTTLWGNPELRRVQGENAGFGDRPPQQNQLGLVLGHHPQV